MATEGGVRRSIWRADYVAAIALFAFVAGAVAIDVLAPGTSVQLVPYAGVLLAVVPAALWLVLFYQLDRSEPEPRRYVIGVFALGALLAAAVGIPLVNDFFRAPDWLGADLLVQLVGSILVIGFAQEGLKYLAVRLTVYETSEFDEMTDGVIYGTAAGLGYAAVLSLNLVIESGGIGLGIGALTVAVLALAHGSLGGLVGHFMAGQKLERRPVWWTSAGLVLAAVLSGLFLTVRSIVIPGTAQIGGLPVGPILGLLVAAVMAGAIALALVRLVRRGQREQSADPVAG